MTTLLLVDDNELDVERVERALAKLGVAFPVVRAMDGREALDRVRGIINEPELRMPFVVLLDINMPRMNGIEFLRELRSIEGHLAIPVFVFTTSNHPRDLEEAHKLFVNGYIVKPRARQEFMQTLSTLVSFWEACEYPTTDAARP